MNPFIRFPSLVLNASNQFKLCHIVKKENGQFFLYSKNPIDSKSEFLTKLKLEDYIYIYIVFYVKEVQLDQLDIYKSK